MRKPANKARKKLDYPEETSGSRLAAKARKMASRHSAEERRQHINEAMVMVYGGIPATEATLPRR